MNTDKKRYPRAEALTVAEQLKEVMACACTRIEIAGSLRRGKADVGDIELVYVSKRTEWMPPGQLLAMPADAVDILLEHLLASKVLERRKNKLGYECWGADIKLARDVMTGIPADLFATNEASWFNYLVCRTGPAESNTAIAQAARARGWKWEPYSEGFVRQDGSERFQVRSEREVFEFVGMEYHKPENR